MGLWFISCIRATTLIDISVPSYSIGIHTDALLSPRLLLLLWDTVCVVFTFAMKRHSMNVLLQLLW